MNDRMGGRRPHMGPNNRQPGAMPRPQGQPVYAAPHNQRQNQNSNQNPNQNQNPNRNQNQSQSQSPIYAVTTLPKRLNNVWIIAISVMVAALCLVLIVSVVSCTSVANNSMEIIGSKSQSDEGASDGIPKIGIISLEGTIQYDGSSCSPSGLRTLLDRAEKRDDIQAVVLRVNSGGGVATAGEEMAHYIKGFDKPIVVSSASTNASAAYEISSQADYIFTAKTTAIGAIGVALEVTDLSGLYEKLGIRIESITSTDSKDSSYGNRPLTDAERAWYQNLVNQIDEDFVNTVAVGRHMEVSQVRSLANGMTYTGSDAVENGLADEIGYLEDAVQKASKLAGYNEPLSFTTLSLSEQSSLMALLDALGQAKSGDSLKSLLEEGLGEDTVVR